ncbi:unnamed protein product [Fraxinus pennsylvanica]|uniref:Ribosomal protein S6 n=1 Tax=Fraxinus pennsylvanica TaxID=56036 RepID=A0AAD2DV59_9LAMI|nr:unnamed protein product [Fraxinus pennsylvanica]
MSVKDVSSWNSLIDGYMRRGILDEASHLFSAMQSRNVISWTAMISGFNMSYCRHVCTVRHYEVVYLIHENHKEEVEQVNTKVQEFLEEKKGKIWRFSDWGMRRLAYKIQKAKNAHYILMNFELEAKWINDFKSMLDKDERVIRHLVMKKDRAETEDCPPPPEFGTLRADMNDDEDDDEEDEDEDWDDEGDVDIVYVDDDVDDEETSSERGKQKAYSGLN